MTNNTPSLAQLKRAVQIQEQIEALQTQLTAVLGGQAGTTVPTGGAKRGRKPGSKNKVATDETDVGPAKPASEKKGKRTMSPEAREKIAAAQRKRWAKTKRAAKKAATA